MDSMAKAAIQNEFRLRFLYHFDKDPTDSIQMAECRYFEECAEDERKDFEAELDDYLSERINYLTSDYYLSSCSQYNLGPVFIEVPALLPYRFKKFISKFNSNITEVILVKTTDELRNIRAKERNIKDWQLEERLQLQSEDIPVNKYIITTIENNGTFDELNEKVLKYCKM
jgi:dephospho-CoA kinase